MKAFLKNALSRRFGYDGWALSVKGADKPLHWTASTTRQECRELRKEAEPWIRPDIEIVKVKITVEKA
jgi:hypothetical protein